MKILVITGLLVLVYAACGDLLQNPPLPPSNSPKIIDLEFEGDFYGISDEWHLLETSALSKLNFHIEQYNNIDSIIFKASVRSERENVRCIVELYNLTDEVVIPGSVLFSRIRYQLHSVRSNDLKYDFPNKEIELGVRIRSEQSGNYVEARHFSLLIYYH